MEKMFLSPSRYVQGKDVTKTGLSHITELGKNALLLCDDTVWQIVGERFQNDLITAGEKVYHVPFNGEASLQEIERVSEIGRKEGTTVVIGLGGGKTIDAAKAIGDKLDIAVAIVPTVASTDAPTSALSVIYSEAGTFETYLFYKKNPDLVLVDTQVIASAPVCLLASGIADASASWVDGSAVIRAHGQSMSDASPTVAAEAIAKKCEETLFANGLQAIEACRSHVVTPALE